MSRSSRMRKTLSWIVGTDRQSGSHSRTSVIGLSKQSNQLDSQRSFLPSFDAPPIVSSPQKEISPNRLKRPPPFFHSRPLPESQIEQNNESQEANTSATSVNSTEIATWKVRLVAKESSETDLIQRHKAISPLKKGTSSRLTALKALLRPEKLQRTSSIGHSGNEKVSTMGSNGSRSVKSPFSFSTGELNDHALATPDLTLGSHSFTPSIDLNTLSPPPRPKHASFVLRRSNTVYKTKAKEYHSPNIDPAKWAEISISAADLVSHFGRENVLFASASLTDSQSDEESVEEMMITGDSSFFERDDECGSLHSSPLVEKTGVDPSITASSMVGSMTSLSKWPLPPLYEKFEPHSVA